MNKKKDTSKVIIPGNHPSPPESHEVDAALILSRHFNCSVDFIIPVDDYMRKSADILMLGTEWELKCPFGASKSTIENQFRRASKQAKNIVLDTRHTKLDYDVVEKKVLLELRERPSMKRVNRVILINKLGKIIEIKK